MKHLQKYLVGVVSLVGVLFLVACSTEAQLGQTNIQNQALATLDAASGAKISYYKGNPDIGGVLVSERSFSKDRSQNSREAMTKARDAAIEAGADYVLLERGNMRMVKTISDFDNRSSFRGRGSFNGRGSFRGQNSELKSFYEGLSENAQITVELFTAAPDTGATAVASFTMTKDAKSRESRQATMSELQASLEAANLTIKDITHKRLSSGGQSVVIESPNRGRGFRNNINQKSRTL